MIAAQSGEDWAIARLWRELNPRLLRFLSGRAGAQDAEDVASETWRRVARSLPRFRGSEIEFRAWFFTIARRSFVDWQRTQCRRPPTRMPIAAIADPLVVGAADEALEILETEQVVMLIHRLPTDQAEVLLLRIVAGLDTAHVARVLGKKPGAIRVLQHRGLRRLAELVAPSPAHEGVTK